MPQSLSKTFTITYCTTAVDELEAHPADTHGECSMRRLSFARMKSESWLEHLNKDVSRYYRNSGK
jgi:hypothetical protein